VIEKLQSSGTGVMDLQPSEFEALDTAALLIKYSAESPKTLPETIVLPIANAWQARDNKTWSPDTSTKFWTAYSALCDLLKPVTRDTINACTPNIKKREWILFGPFRTISLAQRTTRRYLVLLFALLVTSVLFGFIQSSASKLSDDIRDLATKGDGIAVEVFADLTSIKADLDALAIPAENSMQFSLDDPRIKPETRTKINTLRDRLQDLYYVCDLMHQKIDGISFITSFSGIPYTAGDLSRLPVLENGFDNVMNYYEERRNVAQDQQSVYLLSAFYAALVPLLLGAIGACTYVLRLMSDQIGSATFSTTSPVRHFVRITLGALAGVAIGLGGLVTSSGLSAAALAFLAGYAVEPVFSTLDGIAAKFRNSP
jgi:hypothetical protein